MMNTTTPKTLTPEQLAYQETFARVEKKYLLNQEQYDELRKRLEGMAEVDMYGDTQILNIYCDTPNYHLVRKSIEKPDYKEKLRLRCYGVPGERSTSFLEIKKKYAGIVYKRRVAMPYWQGADYIEHHRRFAGNRTTQEEQVYSEIDYMLRHYPGLKPAMVVSYKRIAMVGINDPELRITFDRDIRWRKDNLDLTHGADGKALLKEGQYLMEVKIKDAMSMELARILSELKIFEISYSKYGAAYQDMLSSKPRELRWTYAGRRSA